MAKAILSRRPPTALLALLESALDSIEQADSLVNVAGFALRKQNCDVDADCANVLQSHVYVQLRAARQQIELAIAELGGEQPSTGGAS